MRSENRLRSSQPPRISAKPQAKLQAHLHEEHGESKHHVSHIQLPSRLGREATLSLVSGFLLTLTVPFLPSVCSGLPRSLLSISAATKCSDHRVSPGDQADLRVCLARELYAVPQHWLVFGRAVSAFSYRGFIVAVVWNNLEQGCLMRMMELVIWVPWSVVQNAGLRFPI